MKHNFSPEGYLDWMQNKERIKMNTIKDTYRGVEITYNEKTNDWRFELRSRERTAESLTKAKEIIDKPEPKEKAPFDKVEAWMLNRYSLDCPKTVVVTSLAAAAHWDRSVYVWVTEGKSRSKEMASSVYRPRVGWRPHCD